MLLSSHEGGTFSPRWLMSFCRVGGSIVQSTEFRLTRPDHANRYETTQQSWARASPAYRPNGIGGSCVYLNDSSGIGNSRRIYRHGRSRNQQQQKQQQCFSINRNGHPPLFKWRQLFFFPSYLPLSLPFISNRIVVTRQYNCQVVYQLATICRTQPIVSVSNLSPYSRSQSENHFSIEISCHFFFVWQSNNLFCYYFSNRLC